MMHQFCRNFGTTASRSLRCSSSIISGRRVVVLAQQQQQQQLRSMSMISLEGESEIEKFRMVNARSILMFTATWCPPCKVIKPVYEELSKENTDVAFGLVDVDENQEAALEFEISAVPTFVFFDGEKAVNKMPGADSNQLVKLVNDLKAR